MQRRLICFFPCNILRQFQVNGARAFLLGQSKGFPNAGRYIGGTDNLVGVLGQRLHHAHNVDNLKLPLLAALDRFLPGDHEHRHAAELCVGGRGYEICRARPQGRKTHAGLSGESTIRGGHEACSLFVARQHEFDVRAGK